MSFANSAAIATATSFVESQNNSTLQMFEEFLDSYRTFSHALPSVLRAPAPVFAYADWRPLSLHTHMERACADAQQGYDLLDDAQKVDLWSIAQELDSRAVAAIVMIRRQQRRGTPPDMGFVESCTRAARGLSESLRRFECALDPLRAYDAHQKGTGVHSSHMPALELVTNVTLG